MCEAHKPIESIHIIRHQINRLTGDAVTHREFGECEDLPENAGNFKFNVSSVGYSSICNLAKHNYACSMIYLLLSTQYQVHTNLAVYERAARDSKLHGSFEEEKHERMKQQDRYQQSQCDSSCNKISIVGRETVLILCEKSNQKSKKQWIR